MTDKELLELAAKAAGYGYGEWTKGGIVFESKDAIWNPLKDDGDALRLAVKMGFGLSIEGRVTLVHNGAGVFEEQSQDFGGDSIAATRRAIVRAAAEIGKTC